MFNTSKDLNHFRKELDTLDKELIKVLEKRLKVVKAIGKYKSKNDLKPLDKKRWKKVLDSRIKLGKKVGLSSTFIKDIFNSIHKYSLSLQRKL